MQVKCKRHPKYKALRKPRAKCSPCLDMYVVSLLETLVKEMKEQTRLMRATRAAQNKDSNAYRRSQEAYRKSLKVKS